MLTNFVRNLNLNKFVGEEGYLLISGRDPDRLDYFGLEVSLVTTFQNCENREEE